MAFKFVNRAKMTTSTTGTGTITLGSASSGYQSFATAGIANTDTFSYLIEDGTAWEIGTGTYSSTGPTVARSLVESSTGALLNLSGSGVTISVIQDAQDITLFPTDFSIPNGIFTLSSSTGIPFTVTQNQNSADVTVAVFQGDRSSPATSDIARIGFRLSDSAGNQDNAAAMSWTWNDATSTSEDSSLSFSVYNAGTESTGLTLDGVNRRVTAGTGWVWRGSTTSDGGQVMSITGSNASGGPTFFLYHTANGVTNDNVGSLLFGGTDAGGTYVNAAQLLVRYADATAGAADGGFDIQIAVDGTLSDAFIVRPNVLGFYTNAGGNLTTVPLVNYLMQTTDYTLTSSATEQKAFNQAANGTLTLPTGVYEFEAWLYITTMNATSGNYAFDPIGAGTAVTDRWGQFAHGVDNNNPLNAGTVTQTGSVTQQTPASAVAGSTGTGAQVFHKGMFRITTAGTIIPSITLVTANAAVVKAGSWFKIARLHNSLGTIGAWS